MNRYRIIILPAAEKNISDAYEWLAGRDEGAAIRWYERLGELILSLESFPERAPLAPEARYLQREIREVFLGRRQYKYRVLFIVTGDMVNVLHVRHGSRLALGEKEAADE